MRPATLDASVVARGAMTQKDTQGPVAQLGERLVRNEEVSGSIPLRSTKRIPRTSRVSLCMGGSSSVAERQLPKLNVAGSIPVSRSSFSTQMSR